MQNISLVILVSLLLGISLFSFNVNNSNAAVTEVSGGGFASFQCALPPPFPQGYPSSVVVGFGTFVNPDGSVNTLRSNMFIASEDQMYHTLGPVISGSITENTGDFTFSGMLFQQQGFPCGPSGFLVTFTGNCNDNSLAVTEENPFITLGALSNINLNCLIHKPVANDDTKLIFSDSSEVLIDVLGNDVGSVGMTITGVSHTRPDLGTVTHSPFLIGYTPTGGLGTDIVTYTITDRYGQTDTGILTVEIQQNPNNVQPPVIVGSPDPNIPITAIADSSGKSIITYPIMSAIDSNGNPVPIICSPEEGYAFPIGSTEVTCTATDSAGRSSSITFVVLVEDKTPPELILPELELLKVEANSPQGALFNYNDVISVQDNGDPNPTISCDPQSGTVFPFTAPSTITTVTCTLTDKYGNSVKESFDVTVQDTTAPTLYVPLQTEPLIASGPTGELIDFISLVSAVDGGEIPVDPNPEINCNPPSPHTFPLGTTTVTCTATDDSGNISPAGEFTVTVNYASFVGFLQPINNDGSSVFKKGSVIPVKFYMTFKDGSHASTCNTCTISYKEITSDGTELPAVNEPFIAGTGDTSNKFRYDPNSEQWIFNLGTKNIADNISKLLITATIDDRKHTVEVSLK